MRRPAARLLGGRRGLVFFGRLDAILVRGGLAGALPVEATGEGQFVPFRVVGDVGEHCGWIFQTNSAIVGA